MLARVLKRGAGKGWVGAGEVWKPSPGLCVGVCAGKGWKGAPGEGRAEPGKGSRNGQVLKAFLFSKILMVSDLFSFGFPGWTAGCVGTSCQVGNGQGSCRREDSNASGAYLQQLSLQHNILIFYNECNMH